jgi:hypothetical protein
MEGRVRETNIFLRVALEVTGQKKSQKQIVNTTMFHKSYIPFYTIEKNTFREDYQVSE